ncbi:hypothetical protein BASA61_008631 [Batrachochytrium salamandrivorans]|nr:hypothetical protein BASA61_008631 [Batrachochytrium salamandrivorans]
MFMKRAVASLDPSSTELPFYFPESVYESIPHSGAAPSPSSEEDDAKTATDYISKRLNLGENDFKVVDSYTDSAGISHVYGTHMVNGASISNHQAAAHVKNGEVTFFSTSFGTEQHLAKRDLAVSAPKATLSFEEVSVIASTKLDIPVYSEFEHALEYVAQPDGKVVYTYKFQLRDNPVTKWVQVWCDATTGEVVQVLISPTRLRTRSSKSPIVIPLKGFSVVANPEFRDLHQMDGLMARPLRYGFTESAGNFQKDNFGKGGQGNDAVTINVLNPSYTNNANFITPPDGQPGVMNMFRFTRPPPIAILA